MITLHHGDCLDILPALEAGSVDMVLADPPYGSTNCSWDSVIDLPSMWRELKRVIKPNGAIVLFGSQPFTSALVMSNPKWFKYQWYWSKNTATGFVNVKKQPLRCIEDIAVFYGRQPTYNPQGVIWLDRVRQNSKSTGGQSIRGNVRQSAGRGQLRSVGRYSQSGTNYPRHLLKMDTESVSVHPTQKPVPLLQYLIRTYTNKGDTVLDFCMGSGSTGVACVLEGRSFIGIEKDTEHGYFEIAQKRIHEAETAPRTMRMELTA